MTPTITKSHLCNPLAGVEQLASSSSRLDGVPRELEDSVRYAGARLTQAAGVLLRLPQDLVARAVVLCMRFYTGPEGGSLRDFSIERVSAACIYTTAKLSADPQSPRNVLNVYAYLLSGPFSDPDHSSDSRTAENTNPEAYYLSEGSYMSQRNDLMKMEARILRVLGFETHVALPYTLAINYLQALDAFRDSAAGSALSRRTFAHLTSGLLSPQLLYLTHQPPALATAAIYLAARELDIKLPAEEWWRVFDVDREDLGFLVVAMLSMEAFAATEKEKWRGRGRAVPLSVEALEAELERGG